MGVVSKASTVLGLVPHWGPDYRDPPDSEIQLTHLTVLWFRLPLRTRFSAGVGMHEPWFNPLGSNQCSHSISHSIFITSTLDQSIKNQLIELPINQSINQPVNQSISVSGHQPILHLSNLFHDPLVTWWLLYLCQLHFLHLCGVSGHWTLWNKKGGCRDEISYCDNLIQDSRGQKFVNILKFLCTHSWHGKVHKLLWLPEVQEIFVKTLFMFYWEQNSAILMWFSAKWVFAGYILHFQRGCADRSF